MQAYAGQEFREVSKGADVVGKWAVFSFYPADFTFVLPTDWKTLANKYEEFKAAGCRDLQRILRQPFCTQGMARCV